MKPCKTLMARFVQSIRSNTGSVRSSAVPKERVMSYLKSKVLVVDDSSTQRLAWVMEFTKCGLVAPLTARHGEEALGIARGARPDLLVTDLDMPVMDGGTLVREIKALYPDLLVIVVTGEAKPEFRTAMRAYQNVHIFEKTERAAAMQTAFAQLGRACMYASHCTNAHCRYAAGTTANLTPPMAKLMATA